MKTHLLYKDSIVQVPYGTTKRLVLNEIKTFNSVKTVHQKLFSKIMTMKTNSPYAFRSSDRVNELNELRSIKKGMQSPFKETPAPRISLKKRATSTSKTNPVKVEDPSCFITQTNYIFPNILHRTRDKLDYSRYKAAVRSMEQSRGKSG